MGDEKRNPGPIMRLFQVKIKKGRANTLLHQFATTSATIVRDKPGNVGYFFGKGVAADDDRLVFASFWKDPESVKQHFGDDWQSSYLPEGYENLIEECSVCHIDLSDGWFVRWAS